MILILYIIITIIFLTKANLPLDSIEKKVLFVGPHELCVLIECVYPKSHPAGWSW